MRNLPHRVLLAVGILIGTSPVRSLPVEGRLRLPGTLGFELAAAHTNCSTRRARCTCYAVFADQNIKSSKIKLVLSVNGGSELQAFPTIDGSFLFPDVPAGTHMLDVISVDLLFPQARLQCLLLASQEASELRS